MLSETVYSTTTPVLATVAVASKVFTLDAHDEIVASCYSDVAGSLAIQQSFDGTNWDIVKTIAYTAAAVVGISVPIQGRYGRVVYTNGGVNQTTFRLYVAKKKGVDHTTELTDIHADIGAILADIGDASASTLGSLLAILGNPATALATTLALIQKTLGLTTYGTETAAATDVDGTTWKDLLDKSALTGPTEIWGFKATSGGVWAGDEKIRIITGAGVKIWPFGTEAVEGTDFIDATDLDFPAPVCVPEATGYKVQFRSSDAGDGAGETLALTVYAVTRS